MFSLAYKDDAAWNESHWQNEQFNKILREAKAELNQEKRTEMYREMQQLCRDDGGTVVPFFRNRVYARRSNVMHGPDLAGNWELDGARSFQRWWFA
jgi:peptide/nickel transport system substrate-binding protein